MRGHGATSKNTRRGMQFARVVTSKSGPAPERDLRQYSAGQAKHWNEIILSHGFRDIGKAFTETGISNSLV